MNAESVLRSRTFRRVLLGVLSAILALFLLELPALLELVDYRTLIGPERAWWAPNITDPELQRIHRPHARQRGSSRGGDAAVFYQIPASDRTPFQWDVRYDQNGFRNAQDLKSADIVVVGDSFVEGLTVPDAQLVTSVLARLQGKVVANLGQSAYGPLEELIVLKRYGFPLRPHTVVWMFFEGNDLGDVLAYHRAMRDPPSFWRSFVGRSFTRNAVKEVKHILFGRAEKLPGVKRSGILCLPGEGKQSTVYFIYPAHPLKPDEFRALDETTSTLVEAQKLCIPRRAHLMFVFIPSKFRVFHSFCRLPAESECSRWSLSDLPLRLETAMRSISPQVQWLDLTAKFEDAVRSGVLPYYRDDAHWTPEGHRIAAQAINDALSAMQKQPD